jgi:flagellin
LTSILTNRAAMAANAILRTVSSQSGGIQSEVTTGLRIAEASDDAAYWSISTTMRSDALALATVGDALGLGLAKVDVAYAGISSVIDVLADFRAKVVAASEPGVDKSKVQKELEQLKNQVVSIVKSSSFNGVNWLGTDIADIHDPDLDTTHITSSFGRRGVGQPLISTIEFHLSEVSLFNSTGGGLLEKDNRKSLTLGGIRNYDTYMMTDGEVRTDRSNGAYGSRGEFQFDFAGPIAFTDPSDQIRFNVLVDKDNPADLDPPYEAGRSSLSLSITRDVVDTVLPSANGVISSYTQYLDVLRHVLGGTGASASQVYGYDDNGDWRPIPDRIAIHTQESSGLDGSYIEISGLNHSGIGTGGLQDASDFGSRGSDMILSFMPFTVHSNGLAENGVEVSFNFGVNGVSTTSHSFNRTYVNELFERDTGTVETTDEMVTLLKSLISADWPDVVIETVGPSTISVRSDEDVDRLSGTKTDIGFSGIDVDIEPLSELAFLEIDIVNKPEMSQIYLGYINNVLDKVTDGAAALGALRSRIDMQSEFTRNLIQTMEKGIGKLVDANMNEASTRLKALQVQEQLAIQSLSIANQNTQIVAQLFS